MSVVLVGEAWYSDPWIILVISLERSVLLDSGNETQPGAFLRICCPYLEDGNSHYSHDGSMQVTDPMVMLKWPGHTSFFDRFQNGPKFMAHKWDP